MRRVLVPRELSPLPLAPWSHGAQTESIGGETMGTTWSVKLVRPPHVGMPSVRGAIDEILARMIAQMSTWLPDSDISRFNRAVPGSWHMLPNPFFEILRYALSIAEQSKGAYDPTVGALVELWGFGPTGRRASMPDAQAIAAARMQCGWRRLTLDLAGRRALQPGGTNVDLSSVAKGFAVDALADRLEQMGVMNYLVEIGGELRGQGTKPDGSPWWVALEQPRPACARTLPETLVALHGLAVATSGDGQRAFEVDGRRISHTIDPRSGYPVPDRVASVTVLYPRCMCADALATALMVLGPADGLDHARRYGLAARFVLRSPDGLDEHTTDAFDAMLD